VAGFFRLDHSSPLSSPANLAVGRLCENWPDYLLATPAGVALACLINGLALQTLPTPPSGFQALLRKSTNLKVEAARTGTVNIIALINRAMIPVLTDPKNQKGPGCRNAAEANTVRHPDQRTWTDAHYAEARP
jgi:hypothetical protein